ncbi:sorting nexin-20 isoform X2 [Bradysia coprophila]|uniref:sorting nexin-20 isoform X2 n=2 Tax=Bradysia coprophila TaxID=38358 RepID=UPI00187D9241|nr:sorting nexin-20 isoform X2 [Bradysia coprophila]
MYVATMRRSSNPNAESIDETDDSPVEGLEEGTLAIGSRTNGRNVIDIWKNPAARPAITNGIHFEIPYARVMPPDSSNTSVKKFVVYDIIIRHDQAASEQNSAVIERRYTHFLQLYTNLKRDHSQLMQKVDFPKKAFIGNFSGELIAERSNAFERFLDYVVSTTVLRESAHFLAFLQEIELDQACQLLDERRNEQAVPILENCFRLLNKIYTDRSKCVLLVLCRLLAAATTSPVPHPFAEKFAEIALRRFDHVSDADLLVLYVPLLQTCVHLWWQRGRDSTLITERLNGLEMKGINTKGKTLTQAIHALDPRGETN